MIGNAHSTYIIAEAGVNHNGDKELAFELIRKAAEVGADCVKFQTFKAEQIVTANSPKASYQLLVTDKTENQYQMLKKLELKHEDYPALLAECKKLGIDFLSTPYTFDDIDFLDSLGVPAFKIASGQLTEIPFLEHAARKGRKMIISTGMGTLSDVFNAVEAVRKAGNEQIVLLQCTTNYPSSITDANVSAMVSMEAACKTAVGYSDHVVNNYACYAAVALGATIIEKHFTLDKSLPGPDHSTSLTPEEFKVLILGIREVEKSLGNGIKRPAPIELENASGMKRSLVVLQDMQAGEVLTREKIGFKRPFNGLAPNQLGQVLGKELACSMKKDEAIQYGSINWGHETGSTKKRGRR